MTVVHPQLRDLISCPRERGVLYHVKGSSIVQLTVDVHSQGHGHGDEDGEGQDDGKRLFPSSQAISREWWCPSVSRGHAVPVSGDLSSCFVRVVPIAAGLVVGVHPELLDGFVSSYARLGDMSLTDVVGRTCSPVADNKVNYT